MCGIVGYTGDKQAAPILLSGLEKLEYRGYDSAGLAVRDGKLLPEIVKAKGRLIALKEKTNDGKAVSGCCGIGHTRWATHGEPSELNAHPHATEDREVVGVHNGIIENYQELREKLIIEYSPLVKLVAGRLSMYLGYNVEYDDLVSYGIFGLIDAIDKFDLGKEVKFETYASLRIRGTILDQIRKMDWIPRTVRQKQKKIDEAIKQVEMRTGKNASDEEIAQELGLSEDELTTWQSQLKVTNIVSLNEYLEQGAEPVMDARRNSHFIQPEDKVEEEELKQKLEESLEVLTEKERKVILLYYYEDLTLKEISSILEVSESRISQLHTKALLKMRKKLGNYLGILIDRE